jgi:hypothetical protein
MVKHCERMVREQRQEGRGDIQEELFHGRHHTKLAAQGKKEKMTLRNWRSTTRSPEPAHRSKFAAVRRDAQTHLAALHEKSGTFYSVPDN